MNKIQTTINYFKETEDLSYRQFADELNKSILSGEVSHQTISNWIAGNSTPQLGLMLQVYLYSDPDAWQYKMAKQLIKIIEKNLKTG